MSSERAVSLPRTAVALGITDPVEAARAELKAALSAIEEKVNVAKQVERKAVDARLLARREPAKAAAIAIVVAVAIGGVVWAAARSLTR